MSEVEERDWYGANQAYLMAALDRVRADIERHLGRPDVSPGVESPESIAAAMDEQPALEYLATVFGLSPFERDVLLMCAGVELDARFAALCRPVAGGRPGPTFSLALAALNEAHWSALAPTSALRYWKMIEVGPGEGLVTAPLRIDERALHYLTGVSYTDERLHGVAKRCFMRNKLPLTRDGMAGQIAGLWANTDEPWPAVQLCGEDESSLQDVAASACAMCDLDLYIMRAAEIPIGTGDRELLCRLWNREALLTGSGLLLMVDGSENNETLRAAVAFVERARGPLFVGGQEPLRLPRQTLPRFDIRKPDSREQGELWRQALGPLAARMNGQIERLVNQFNLGRPAIATATAMLQRTGEEDPDEAAALLWETCRRQSRARLDDLAQRIETTASWDDLVLPDLQMQILREIVTHVRQRVRVYDHWGFAARNSRGLGISALFAGASGTGKTLAAEIMANKLRLDLYRIDLSQVVSKYIGETEKNLRRVFDAAEAAGAVLLFDEADALFGKRSEVKDSHDRYANIEVSYLLQRMEAYRGLAILTTNMKQALDPAFMRRIRFVVQFPFPGAEERAEIWRRVFPEATPKQDLYIDRLARLNVAGGNIRNIALGAAFLAADEDRPVGMAHLLRAARAEYAKLERPLTDSEIAGWV
jgi:ATPase family protein associated with various cellular activities (AAA)/winged helix domain-containing protein